MKTSHGGAPRRARRLLAACCLAVLAGGALAQDMPSTNPCGALQNAYGPYDYRTHRHMLKVVEEFHFSSTVERLDRPTTGNFGDLDYTLRASPNHHRALISLARYGDRGNAAKMPPFMRSIDCYFDRAMRFAKDDPVVRMIYAGHLARTNRGTEALAHLDYVAQGAGDSPFTHYNLGLLYLELKRYDKALTQAHVAMQLGLPRTELRDALKKAGKWTDPQAAAPAEAASAASPAP